MGLVFHCSPNPLSVKSAQPQLIPDTKEADELLEQAMEWFSTMAHFGETIPGTRTYFKRVPDWARGRILVIFYHFDNSEVRLHSVKMFGLGEARN
jgi:hypothetical protein